MHIIEDFFKLFPKENTKEENKKILLDFLKSYEIQRSLDLSQIAAFTNSIKTPTSKLNHKQKIKIHHMNEIKKIEQKKKRSKKYMLLTKYKSDIISLKNENISYEKIAKALIVKYNIIKKLQPSRQNIFNFCKEHNID